jgi:ABC-type dipeptide/oligopeptide/nickel transport system permease subunit
VKKGLRWFWKYNRLGLVAGLLMVLFFVVAVAPQWFATHDPIEMSPERLVPPGDTFVLGTDRFGRDIQSRIIYGIQISLTVGILAMACGALVGTVLGMLAGTFGGTTDYLIMRSMDTLFAFPAVLLAIAIVAVLGGGVLPIVLAIAITFTPTFARVARAPVLSVARAPVLSVQESEYVSAAKAVGVPTPRIMTRHILPNIWSPILVQAALSLSGAIIIEAALSFLGLGIQPPTPSLGSILNEARTYMELAPWTVLFPGLVLALLILGINLFGDAVRDFFDPRMR